SKKVKTTTQSCTVLIWEKYSTPTPNVGFKLGAPEITWCGIGISPVINPTIAVTAIPIKIAPGTFLTIKIEVTIRPMIVNQVVGVVNEPRPTTVDLLATIKPPW